MATVMFLHELLNCVTTSKNFNYRTVGAELPATNSLPRRRIGECIFFH